MFRVFSLHRNAQILGHFPRIKCISICKDRNVSNCFPFALVLILTDIKDCAIIVWTIKITDNIYPAWEALNTGK